jgi:hypothetical protein
MCICAQHSLFSVECAAAFASMNHIIAQREREVCVCCCVLHFTLFAARTEQHTAGELQFVVPGNLMKVEL